MTSTLTDEQLLAFNSKGLIPGPEESEEPFLKRAHYCLALKKEMTKRLGDEVPFVTDENSEYTVPKRALDLAETLYAISPSWIPLFYSNYKLAPWHGGCAWIFQQNDETPTGAFLQLRRNFASKESYLGLYDRNELMAHELSHVGRMCFNELRFEEILAYRSSPSPLRRWLGAIAQSSSETSAFILLLCVILFLDFYGLSSQSSSLQKSIAWLHVLPVGLIAWGFLRLRKRQNEFESCLHRLEKLLHDKHKAEGFIYRLTDREIISFSKMSVEDLRKALEEKKESSLRWRLLFKAYL